MDFFNDIAETESYMITPFRSLLSIENKKFAEDYFEFNKNIRFFIDKEYSWKEISENCLIVNDFLICNDKEGRQGNKLCISKRNFQVDALYVPREESFLSYLDEARTKIERQTIDELYIRGKIVDNLENINKSSKNKILDSLNVITKINNILFICMKEKIEFSIEENKKYKLIDIYQILEDSINMLFIVKDIDIKNQLNELKEIINYKPSSIELT